MNRKELIKKTIRPCDFLEIASLLQTAHHCQLRAAYLLRKFAHISSNEAKQINAHLWKLRKMVERDAVVYYPNHFEKSFLERQHRRPENGEINLHETQKFKKNMEEVKMESISIKQVKEFERKRTKWLADWADFQKRNRQFVETLKDMDVNSLETMSKQKEKFDSEQARLIADKDQIFAEFDSIVKIMFQLFAIIWPGKKIIN